MITASGCGSWLRLRSNSPQVGKAVCRPINVAGPMDRWSALLCSRLEGLKDVGKDSVGKAAKLCQNDRLGLRKQRRHVRLVAAVLVRLRRANVAQMPVGVTDDN